MKQIINVYSENLENHKNKQLIMLLKYVQWINLPYLFLVSVARISPNILRRHKHIFIGRCCCVIPAMFSIHFHVKPNCEQQRSFDTTWVQSIPVEHATFVFRDAVRFSIKCIRNDHHPRRTSNLYSCSRHFSSIVKRWKTDGLLFI